MGSLEQAHRPLRGECIEPAQINPATVWFGVSELSLEIRSIGEEALVCHRLQEDEGTKTELGWPSLHV